jgi:hypothetical protein
VTARRESPEEQMTDPAAMPARPKTIADISSPYPFGVLAAVGFVAGIFWFPAWFVAAQMLRLWSQRGCMTWLKSRGVPEYTDEKYAQIIGYGPIALIAARILLSLNWLEPFQTIADHKLNTAPTPENGVFLGIAFGVALGTALTGFMRTHGLPWLIGAAGFVAVAVLVGGGYGLIWTATFLTGLPVIALGYVTSKIPIIINKYFEKREKARADEAALASAPPKASVFK